MKNHRQYAYAPQEESNRLHTPHLSSMQMTSRLFQRTNSVQSDQKQILDPSANPDPAPPSLSRFKPAPSFMGNHLRIPPAHRQTNMGPPPTPQRVRSERANSASNTNNRQIPDGLGSSRLPLLPPPRSNQQVNVPATPLQSSSGARRFFPGAGLPTKPSQQSNAGLPTSGGQRTPFVPQAQHGRRGGFG